MPKARVIHLGTPELAAINPTKDPLTKHKLRELSGMKDLPEGEAEEIVHSIHLLAIILYDFTRKNQTFCIDYQQVVNLDRPNPEIQKQAA